MKLDSQSEAKVDFFSPPLFEVFQILAKGSELGIQVKIEVILPFKPRAIDNRFQSNLWTSEKFRNYTVDTTMSM